MLKKRRFFYFSLIVFSMLLMPTYAHAPKRPNISSNDCPDCDHTPSFNQLKTRQIKDLSGILNNINLPIQHVAYPKYCALSNPNKKIKNLIFLFEGHEGYSSKLGAAFKKLERLNPDCSTLIFPQAGKTQHSAIDAMSFSNHKWINFYSARDQIHRMVQNSWHGSPVALKAYILRGMCKSGAMNFKNTEVFYFPENIPLKIPVSCAHDYAARRFGNAHRPSLTILGYSYGGDAALRFAQALHRQNVPIDLGMTVDPVPQGTFNTIAAGLASWIDPHVYPTHFRVPRGVRWVNYWEQTDNRIDHGQKEINFGLHGYSVAGAAIDQRVIPKLDPAHPYPNGGHWRIFNNATVEASISRELRAVNNKN